MATVSLQSAFDAARRALDAGTADRAVAIAHYILAHYPRNIEAQRLLGEALLNAGDAEAAAEAFGQVLEADPESVAAYYGRGLAFAARDDRMAAVRSFERALEIQPNLAELRTQLIRLYGEAPGSSPQLRLSRAGLARLYTRGGMYGQAVDEFRAIEAEADRPDVEAALAEALWRDGQEDEAAAYCRQTLDRRPELLKPRLLLGYLLYAGGQPEGEELWRAGAQQDPMLSVARGLFDILPPIRLEDPLLPAFDVDELLAREYTAAQAVPTIPAEVVVEPEPSVAIATRAAEPDAELPASPEVEGPITLPDRPEQPSEHDDAWLADETNAASEGLEPVAPPRDMLSDDALLASLLGIDQLTEHADEQPALSPDSGLAGEQQVAAEAGEDALHARAAPSSLDDSDTEDIAPFTLQDEQIAEDDAPAHTFESGATEDSAAFQADDAGELEQFALDELAFEEDASFSAPAAADQAAPWDDPAFALGQESRSEEADVAPFDELPDTGQSSTLPGQPEATGAAAEPDATRDLFSLDDLADDAASWEQGQQISPADEEQMPFSLAELGIDAEPLSVGAQLGRYLQAVGVPPGCPVASADDDARTQVVQHQQRADAVGVGRALVHQPLQFTVRAARVFVRGRRLVQHRPDALAAVMAQQHRQQLVAIESVGLCTPGAPVDFDARRVDHDVVDALSDQPPVQPPTVAAGLVAAMHPGLGAHTTARSRLGHAVKHRSGITGVDAVPARTATAVADRQLPRPVAELQAHVQLALASPYPCHVGLSG